MLELTPPLLAMTVVGLIAFAASGAVAGARAGMDWLGLTTLAAVTAIGGGTLRDLLMVQVPGWLIDFWPTVAVIATTVIVVWIAARAFPWQRHRHWMARLFTLSDAVGLAAFTVVGTDVALDGGFAAGPAIILGVVSGVGGGIIRDVLAGRSIAIFTGEVYALAALAGSVAFLASRGLGPLAPFLIGVAVVLVIRLGAVAMGWRVPTLPSEEPAGPAA